MGLPARPEEPEAVRRFAPELFGRDYNSRKTPRQEFWDADRFGHEVRTWIAAEKSRSFVTVAEGTCAQPNCALHLGRPLSVSSNSSNDDQRTALQTDLQ